METTGEKQALIFIESKKTRTGLRVTKTSWKTGVGSEWRSVTVNVMTCFEIFDGFAEQLRADRFGTLTNREGARKASEIYGMDALSHESPGIRRLDCERKE